MNFYIPDMFQELKGLMSLLSCPAPAPGPGATAETQEDEIFGICGDIFCGTGEEPQVNHHARDCSAPRGSS